MDEIHAAFARCAPAVAADMEGPVLASWTHDDGSENAAGGEAAGAEGEAVGRAGGATGGLADGHGGGTWTLVSWSAVRGKRHIVAQLKPSGLFEIQRHESSHMSVSPSSAFQPSSFSARLASP